jgi:hypothetical protein
LHDDAALSMPSFFWIVRLSSDSFRCTDLPQQPPHSEIIGTYGPGIFSKAASPLAKAFSHR